MRRILVVDDSATMRAMYKMVLGRLKHCSIGFAFDGRQGLDRILAEEPQLVFLDVNMPEMDGLELLGQLSALGALRRTMVVMVSTEGTDADIARGLALGATAYLRKPFKPNDITDTLERLLPFSDQVTVRVDGGAPGSPGGGA